MPGVPPPPQACNNAPPIYDCTAIEVQPAGSPVYFDDWRFRNPYLAPDPKKCPQKVPPSPPPPAKQKYPILPCQVDGGHRSALLGQIDGLQGVVDGLWGDIQGVLNGGPPPKGMTISFDPDCSGGCSGSLIGKPVLLSIDEVCLSKASDVAPGEPGFSDDLTFGFTAEYQCWICNWDSSDPPQCTICSTVTKTGKGTGVIKDVGAPNVTFDCTGWDIVRKKEYICGGGPIPMKCSGVLESMREVLRNLNPAIFGTTDEDIDDELGGTMRELDSQVITIDKFKKDTVDFYNKMASDPGSAIVAKDGALPPTNPVQVVRNPVTGTLEPIKGIYSWQDKSGVHKVDVEFGPFKFPATKREKYGTFLVGKTCIELKDYCDNVSGNVLLDGKDDGSCRYDNTTNDPGRTWVRVRLNEPPGKNLGLWTWNPFGAGGRVEKRSCISYAPQQVGISKVDKPSLWPKFGFGSGERCR